MKAKVKKGMLKISVQDTGIGIHPDKISKLFKLFGKLENAELNPQGRGLGLHISNMLVLALGGSDMQIKSQEGLGTQVKFEIQALEEIYQKKSFTLDSFDSSSVDEYEQTYTVPKFQTKFFKDVERHTVLIVDDNEFNRSIFGDFLKDLGIKYDEAYNGAEAVELVKTHNNSDTGYKIVIMDCEMPIMNGWKASQEIHKLYSLKKIQSLPNIIGCTAYSNAEESSRCKEAGMICLVQKPVPKKHFLKLVKDYLY